MKMRLGFVSNSSSSSFVAAIKTDDYFEIVKRVINLFSIENPDIINLLRSSPVVTDDQTSLIHIFADEESCGINRGTAYYGDNLNAEDFSEFNYAICEIQNRIKKKTKLYYADQ
jgi:hypothetical protein